MQFEYYCSSSIQLSLLILLLGVGIATITDVQLNALGSILSLLAVLTTCVAQIVSFTITSAKEMKSLRLLVLSTNVLEMHGNYTKNFP